MAASPLPWPNTHLDRRPATVEDVLDDSLGIYATQPTGHLELLARLPNYARGELDRVVVTERRAVRLRTLRGSAFLIPIRLLPLTQGATRSRNARAFGSMLRKRLATPYETWAERILELLADGPLGRAEIKAALGGREDPELLGYCVAQLATENRIVAVPMAGRWRSDRIAFHRWEDWVPDVDVWSLPEDEARSELARAYLDRHGPATIEDFSWWSGLTKEQAQRAVGAVAEPAKDDYWATQPAATDDPPPLRLLPIWDTLFVTYRDRRRFLDDEHYPLVYDASGNATSVVLAHGRAAGVWQLGKDDERLEIEAAPFRSFSAAQWAAIASEAARIGQMIGSVEVTVTRREGPVDLTQAPRNRFRRPLG